VLAGPWTFGWEALVALGTIGLALFAFVQLLSYNRRERRRDQPVAIAHNAGGDIGRMYVYLTNEGTGTAFNVRFGVKLDRREYAVGGGQGHRYTVAPGQRVPPTDHFEVEVHSSAFVVSSQGGGVYARRQYWARYENAYGRVWETRNPVDPAATFKIFPSSALRRAIAERRQRFGRRWDARMIERWHTEEVEATQQGRELTYRQRTRRWFERQMR
jgi:hypothetical protein